MADIATIVRITGKDETGTAFDSATNRATSFAKNVGSAILGALSLGAFTSAIKGAIDYADQLNDLSKRTGITVETLGALGYAAKQNGIDLETVAKGTQKLAESMVAGNPAFARMGVSIKDADGQLLGLDETLFKIADKFKSYADGPEKAALATEIFKKSGAALIPLLDEGGEKLRALVEEYQKYGGVTTDTAQRADLFNDTIERIKLIQGSLWREIASALLPTLQALANIFVDAKSKGEGFKGIAETITGVVKVLGIAVIGVAETFKTLGTYWAAIFAAMTLAMSGDFKGAWTALKLGWTDVTGSISTAIERAKTVWNASSADMAESAARNFGKVRAPVSQAAKAVDDFAKQLDDLMAKIEGRNLGISGEWAKQFDLLTQGYNRGFLSLDRYRELTEKLLNQQPWAKKEAEALAALIKLEEEALKALQKLQEEATKGLGTYADTNKRIEEENKLIGLTEEARARALVLLDAQADRQLQINAGDLVGLDLLDQQIAKRQDLVAQQITLTRETQATSDMFRSLADRGARFITDFVQHGASAFKNLWNDFKTWALEAFAKIAAQQIIIKLTAGTSLGGIATNALAGSGGSFGGIGDIIGNLFGGGGGSGIFGSLGASFSNLNLAVTAGVDSIGGFGAALGAIAPALGAIGLVAGLAIPLLAGLFSKGGGPKEGGTAGANFYPGETSAANNAVIQATVDALGDSFKSMLAAFGGKGSASFGLGYDTDPQGTAQNRVSSVATVNGAQVYGARDLEVGRDDAQLKAALELEAQRVVLAALKASDLPDDIAKLFSTIDVPTASAADIAAIEKTAATYKLINDALAALPVDVQDHFTAMLDGSQKTAESVLVVVSVIRTFGEVIDGLGPKLEALDAGQIDAFIDALGGAAKAAAAFAYLGQNFTTAADKMKLAVDALNADFNTLGVTAIPQTHKQFLDLLNSFDLTTDSGRALYASVLDLSNAFVAVHGTADEAAKALDAMTASATDFFKKNFYSEAEQNAQKYAAELKKLADAQEALGVAIPTSVAGFRALIEGIDRSTAAGEALYAALIVLAPTVFDLSGAAADAAHQVDVLVNSIGNIQGPIDERANVQNYVDNLLRQFASLADQMQDADVGDQLATQINLIGSKIISLREQIAHYYDVGDFYRAETLTMELNLFIQANQGLAAQLAEFVTLKAQYGGEIAGQLIDLENWYKEQQAALAGNADALAVLATIFGQRWQAIITGVGTGVDGAISQLDRLRKSIAAYLQGLQISDLSPLTPMEKLAQAKAQFDADFAKAQGGDLDAMGRLTAESDAYLRLARDAYASSQQYTDIFKLITDELRTLTIAPPPGSGGPSDPKDPINQALPANGAKIASNEDINGLKKILADLFAAHADAGTEDANAIKTAVERGAVRVADSVHSGLK